MKTWEEYKAYVKSEDPAIAKDLAEAEAVAEIIAAVITQRNAKGITQRELAAMCGMPQTSIARIESGRTTPNLDTLLKLMNPLGLELKVSLANQ